MEEGGEKEEMWNQPLYEKRRQGDAVAGEEEGGNYGEEDDGRKGTREEGQAEKGK